MGRCIVNQAAAYLSLISSIFFLSNFQTLKNFVTFFSETVRPIKLKLDTNMGNGWMYRVYCNQAVDASYLSLILSFFFLSNVQKLKIFVTLFSGTVNNRKFKLSTPVDNGWTYRVYQNQAAAANLSLYFFNCFLSNYQSLTIFVTLFSGTVRPGRLKLGTHVDSGQMYRVYQNQAAVAYSSLVSSIYFPNFKH